MPRQRLTRAEMQEETRRRLLDAAFAVCTERGIHGASIEAIASDAPLPGLGVPVFDLDDVPGIADFILARVGLR